MFIILIGKGVTWALAEALAFGSLMSHFSPDDNTTIGRFNTNHHNNNSNNKKPSIFVSGPCTLVNDVSSIAFWKRIEIHTENFLL